MVFVMTGATCSWTSQVQGQPELTREEYGRQHDPAGKSKESSLTVYFPQADTMPSPPDSQAVLRLLRKAPPQLPRAGLLRPKGYFQPPCHRGRSKDIGPVPVL